MRDVADTEKDFLQEELLLKTRQIQKKMFLMNLNLMKYLEQVMLWLIH